MIHFDIVEGCNFKCWFCPASEHTSVKFMDFSMFERVAREAASLGETVISLVPAEGEPFLHPRIYDMIELAITLFDTVTIVSNGTAINAKKLKQVMNSRVSLVISVYGKSPTAFVELTNASPKMYDVVQHRITQLEQHGIPFTAELRTKEECIFEHDDMSGEYMYHITKPLTTKCKYHMSPKIFVNGDVAFCNHIPHRQLVYASVTNTSLKEVLTSPMRYKFYDSQSICKVCPTKDVGCWTTHGISAVKWMGVSKQQYQTSKEITDVEYKRFEKIMGVGNDE